MQPKWERAAELGYTAEDLGYAIAAITDGAYSGEFFLEDDKIDIFLYSSERTGRGLAELREMSIYAPNGGVVPLSTVVDFVETDDTDAVRRVNGDRTVTLYVIPPREVALETAVQRVQEEVINSMRVNNEIPSNISIDITGASDQLTATRSSLGGNFVVSIVLCYLLLVVIYKHWGYPWIILATVPLEIAGGIVGLWLMNFVGSLLPMIGLPQLSQPFDIITMLGFLILLGTVVNNPILIVDRALNNFRSSGMAPVAAVVEAVETRLRPIMMTTITTIFGLSPLVFIPGAGTELYRGVGAIVLFGLIFSTIVALTFLPALLTIILGMLDRRRSEVGQAATVNV